MIVAVALTLAFAVRGQDALLVLDPPRGDPEVAELKREQLPGEPLLASPTGALAAAYYLRRDGVRGLTSEEPIPGYPDGRLRPLPARRPARRAHGQRRGAARTVAEAAGVRLRRPAIADRLPGTDTRVLRVALAPTDHHRTTLAQCHPSPAPTLTRPSRPRTSASWARSPHARAGSGTRSRSTGSGGGRRSTPSASTRCWARRSLTTASAATGRSPAARSSTWAAGRASTPAP